MLGAVLERVTGMPLPQLFVEWAARPLGLGNTAFHATDAANPATPYYNTPQGRSACRKACGGAAGGDGGGEVLFSPMRALNAGAYPSGGAGMVGDADDVLKLVEALRSGGQGILQPDTVALLRSPHVGAQAQTQGPLGIRFWRGAAGGRRSGADAAAGRHADRAGFTATAGSLIHRRS